MTYLTYVSNSDLKHPLLPTKNSNFGNQLSILKSSVNGISSFLLRNFMNTKLN